MDLVVPLADRVVQLQALSAAARSPSEVGASVEVPADVREAAADALFRGETHYADRPGILPLRERVAAAVASSFGVGVDPKSGVVITCGGTEARFVAVQQLLSPGDTLVALARPDAVAGACLVRGVRRVDGTTSDATSAAQALTGRAALYLDGTVPDAVRAPWLAAASERGWPVVFDADAGGRHPADDGVGDATVTIGSIGLASGMASWRLGYLAAPATTAGPLRDFKQALTICTTNVSQWGALALEELA